MQGNADFRIIATAEDATATKYAAVKAGYYEDPFVGAFHATSHQQHRQQRPVQVIIKRGTFARVASVSRAVRSFLDLVGSVVGSEGKAVAQFVVLGSGKDTMYFRLKQGIVGENVSGRPLIRWIEVDHLSVLQEKTAVIDKSRSLFGLSVSADKTGTIQLGSADGSDFSCHLIAHDLRDDPRLLCDKLVGAGLDADTPTLFISECVFMYLPHESSRFLLESLSNKFTQACFCLYEPILGSDTFGRIMEENLTKAGVAQSSSCLVRTRSLDSYLRLLSDTGFVRAIGCDMYAAYQTILSPEERRRANMCEFLDELEEFVLIMQHYCFVVACTEQSRVGQQLCQVGNLPSPLGFSKGSYKETSASP